MIVTSEIIVERVEAAVGSVIVDNCGAGVPAKTVEATGFPVRRVVPVGETLFDLSVEAVRKIPSDDLADLGGVVAATFSSPERFPGLAVRIASALGLAPSVPTFDIHEACSAYPRALYLAGRLAADTGRLVLVVDGDVQSALTDSDDAATSPLFSDAATATLVSCGDSPSANSMFDFFSRADDALSCPASGPVHMDGFGVFSFVATEVAPFLKRFMEESSASNPSPVDMFVPHQANMYMVRQLARSIGMSDRLVVAGGEYANPGSCSIPLALARAGAGRALLAGFGAGLSAAAAIVKVRGDGRKAS